jgi:hypothetical protein
MVGVHVGAEDARDAVAVRGGGQRAVVGDQLPPGGQHVGRLGAGVDDGLEAIGSEITIDRLKHLAGRGIPVPDPQAAPQTRKGHNSSGPILHRLKDKPAAARTTRPCSFGTTLRRVSKGTPAMGSLL